MIAAAAMMREGGLGLPRTVNYRSRDLCVKRMTLEMRAARRVQNWPYTPLKLALGRLEGRIARLVHV